MPRPLGPSATANAFAFVLSTIANTPRQVDGLGGPNIDSEMRFYSVLWIAYGLIVLWVSRSMHQRVVLLRLMLVVFFLGGLGRALSCLTMGAPHPLFGVLMWLEILIPPILIGLSYARSKSIEAN